MHPTAVHTPLAFFKIAGCDNAILVTPLAAIVTRRGATRRYFYTRLTLASFTRLQRLLERCELVGGTTYAFRGSK